LNGDFQNITDWDGDNPNSEIVRYFTLKLNAKHCPKGVTTDPCNHNLFNYGVTNIHNNHSLRWVLPNGVQIFIPSAYYASKNHFDFVIDTKSSGVSRYARADGEQMIIGCNPAETTSLGMSGGFKYSGIKPGMCSAMPNSDWQNQWNALYS
jgi:hypothetical protein